jgi:hypothetical protein
MFRLLFVSIFFFISFHFFSCGGNDTGNTGDTENTGNTGNTGNSGDTGDTGNSGNSGDTANTGNTGNELLSAVYSSGTRLKVRYIESSDGAKTFHGIWDSELNQACWFYNFDDGKKRCIPYSSGSQISNFYSDSNCENKIDVFMTSSGNSTTYHCVVDKETTNIDGYPTIKIISVHATSEYTGKLYDLSGSNCNEITEAYSSYFLYELGNEIPFNTFQEGSIKTLE